MRQALDMESPGVSEGSRQELADFLRSRRSRIKIDETTLPRGLRRRVSGLRREEVAELSGIGTTWYTWLEQGRPVNVSTATLARIAEALRLDGEEHTHLFMLAGKMVPNGAHSCAAERIKSTASKVLQALDPNPSYLLNPFWDVLAWNNAASEVFVDFPSLAEDERNMVWLAFTNRRLRKKMRNWEAFAHCVLAHFRSDSSAHTQDARWQQIVRSLQEQSEEFRAWWAQHEVAWPQDFTNEIRDSSGMVRFYNGLNLKVQGAPDLKIVSYVESL